MTRARTQPKKIIIRKDQQQQSKRTREQEVNDMYILKQQMTRQNGNLIESGIKINDQVIIVNTEEYNEGYNSTTTKGQ